MKSAVEPIALLMLKQGKHIDKYALAEEARCHQRTAQRVLRGMHQLKMVYVASWVPIYKQHMPVYALCPGKDIPKPVLTVEMFKDRAKKLRRKKRRDPEVRIAEMLKKRMKRAGNGTIHQPRI